MEEEKRETEIRRRKNRLKRKGEKTR